MAVALASAFGLELHALIIDDFQLDALKTRTRRARRALGVIGARLVRPMPSTLQ